MFDRQLIIAYANFITTICYFVKAALVGTDKQSAYATTASASTLSTKTRYGRPSNGSIYEAEEATLRNAFCVLHIPGRTHEIEIWTTQVLKPRHPRCLLVPNRRIASVAG